MSALLGLSVAFGGVGIAGAIAAFFKIRPERDSIIVSAAQGAVLVQTTILDELKEELDRVNDRADALAVGQRELRDQLEQVTEERDYLRTENQRLHRQVERHERRIGELERIGTGG